ncbi:MAG: circularly permuted type 2 ATP-grasp protein [Planctomycetota bacterium]|nr:circularly permuted type 2 ATP-grasp protein [Planctomycetota bacterium]
MDAQYQKLLDLAPYGPSDYQRWESAKQSLRDNPPSSTGQLIKAGTPQAWELDPIPVVLDSQEWESFAGALSQRMRLIDLLLQDVYGPQRWIAEGILPAQLVYKAPGYIRAARRAGEIETCALETRSTETPMLYLYAVQASRSASGRWLVHADRTQGPSGCGHAIENRLAISRIHAESFQSLQVSRIADFFMKLRQAIQDRAPGKDKSMRTLLLSPGVQSPTYFEDAYLARYLGYTLSQSADLTVRGGNLYLKTLGGLLPVDCILRRLADTQCDPLDIDPNHTEGVAGLAAAAKLGNVFLANALGTGWSESPGVTAMLPKLAKSILNEELRLANSPMWWCGDPESLEYTLDHFREMWIRDAFVRHSANQIDVAALSAMQQDQLLAQIRAEPWAYVAVEPPKLSYVPTWVNRQVVAWPAMFRFFASHHRGQIHVLPGGVARVAADPRQLDESLASGTMSKDVWVLSQGPVKPVSLLSGSRNSSELRRSGLDLPSRVAEHLLWLGRFCERTEFLARHARYCTSQLTSERASDSVSTSWWIVRALSDFMGMAATYQGPGYLGPTYPNSANEFQIADSKSATVLMRGKLAEFLLDRTRSDGIANAIDGILRNAQNIRDRLSFDSWQIISRLDYSVLVPWATPRNTIGDTLLILNQIIGLLSAFSGLASESMTRGPGWLFLDLGRRIERAHCLLRLLDRTLVPVQANHRPILESLLDICDCSMTYRYRYLMSFETGPVLDLLVADQTNPRGLSFQFMKIANHLDALNIGDKTELAVQRKRLSEIRGSLRLFDSDAIGEFSEENTRLGISERTLLKPRLAEYTESLIQLTDFITRRFFTHTHVRQLQDMVNQ